MSDITERLNAALEGRYRVERELGEGGMATVYLAQDLKHRRKVALKLLKPELAAVVGAERFLAEIEVTAGLQHPHILPLFDSGEADGFLFYVMPYVEGESLRDRIDREKQLPVDEAVAIATTVAQALQHAHERGVIHRDIKPANILMQDGQPVIADFGIALAVGAAGGARLTETGLSVGTPYYMSPEQATGDQALGPSSDTYALACVLYEMLVGEPPYVGPTAQAVLGKIIAGQVTSATELRPSIPLHVDAALQRALEKLPADRFPDATAFVRALGDPSFRHGTGEMAAADPTSGPWRPAALALASTTILFAAGFVWALSRGPAEDGVLRYTLPAGGVMASSAEGFGPQIAISPDGRTVVMPRATERSVELVVRRRGDLEMQPLPGTEGAHQPFFAPGGERLGFVSIDRELGTTTLTGEPPLMLLDSGVVRFAATWSDDDYIYFTQGTSQGLATGGLGRIPASGGAIEAVTTLAPDEVDHGFAEALPGGRGVLFVVSVDREYDPETQMIAVVDVETGEHRRLFPGVAVRWSVSGHLLVVDKDGTLSAVPFDPDELEAEGRLIPLLSGVAVGPLGGTDLTISKNGTLVYGTRSVRLDSDRIVWVSRDGGVQDVDRDWRGRFAAPALSPDFERVALEVYQDGEQQIWIKELDTGESVKLTFQGSRSGLPSWTPDGDTIVFVSNRAGDLDAYARSLDQSPPTLLLDLDAGVRGVRVSPDGDWLVYVVEGRQSDIYALPRAGGDAIPLAVSGGDELEPVLSPDGRWIAYSSTEAGSTQVFVRPFPNASDGFWQVSRDWGQDPAWSPDGSELVFRSRNTMMVVPIGSGLVFSHGEPRPLFSLEAFSPAGGDVLAPDGRLLMVRREDGEGELVVVENFFEELRDRVGR